MHSTNTSEERIPAICIRCGQHFSFTSSDAMEDVCQRCVAAEKIVASAEQQIAHRQATDNLWMACQASQNGNNPVPYVIEAMAAMKAEPDAANALMVLTEPILWKNIPGPMRWLTDSCRQRLRRDVL